MFRVKWRFCPGFGDEFQHADYPTAMEALRAASDKLGGEPVVVSIRGENDILMKSCLVAGVHPYDVELIIQEVER